MSDEIRLHDVVVLTGDIPTRHFESGRPITLRRGQVGTVVMTLAPRVFEVEFADKEGRPYAMLPVAADKLIVLRDEPEVAAA
ncbi:MAG: DUF4926 domain-containing protein [Verrucomicrobiae bacterium]|nr:DUF4926 domain-containing protein [Verrucomicrobiae bacterium]